jgi:hypothetical protein
VVGAGIHSLVAKQTLGRDVEAAGGGLLFNPANLHAVTPNPGGRRIAFAFFLGLTTTGNLIAWS